MARTILLHVACLCLVALVPHCDGYGTGPPISTHPAICTDMTPSALANPNGHGASPQTGAAPFEVVINQNCYKAGVPVQVVVRTPSTTSTARYKGLFVQAREVGGTVPLGSFSVSDSALTTLTCTGLTTNSAVGQNRADQVSFRSMMWTPPSSVTPNMRFRVTVVQDQATFWVGLESSIVTYNSACVASPLIPNPNGSGSGTNVRAAPYCLALALVFFMTAIFYR